MATEDLPLVRAWTATSEVARWWSEPDDLEEGLADPHTNLWIVSLAGRPFAWMQDYDPRAWPGHHFAFLPVGSRGIDQLIGIPPMIGHGFGSAFIRTRVDQLFAEGTPAVGTDPHPDNARAIRAYEKAGFVRREIQDTDWGLALLMTRYRDA
jgi:aminoglycoside 6'-N-acetyltransferase